MADGDMSSPKIYDKMLGLWEKIHAPPQFREVDDVAPPWTLLEWAQKWGFQDTRRRLQNGS